MKIELAWWWYWRYTAYHTDSKPIEVFEMEHVATVSQMRAILDSTAGKVFSVSFVKKDGSVRDMVCRNEVSKGTSGGVAGHAHKEELYTVWDMQAAGFRCVNLTTVKRIKCGELNKEWYV